jgi:hypothetical protein
MYTGSLCTDCAYDSDNACFKGQYQWPVARTCTAYSKVKEHNLKGEFTEMSLNDKTKCMKYASFK